MQTRIAGPDGKAMQPDHFFGSFHTQNGGVSAPSQELVTTLQQQRFTYFGRVTPVFVASQNPCFFQEYYIIGRAIPIVTVPVDAVSAV